MKVRVTKEMQEIENGKFSVYADDKCVLVCTFKTNRPPDDVYNEQRNQDEAMDAAKKYEAIDKLPDLITIYETAE